jgi:hypothetical protein
MPTAGQPALHGCEGCKIGIDTGTIADGSQYWVIKMNKYLEDARLFFDNLESIRDFHRQIGEQLDKFKEAE